MAFFIGIASLAVFLFSLFPITDYDIWFHLAEGKLMIQNWYFPYTDVFSYTAQGAPNYPNSWGFTAFSYAAFKLFGLDGLNIIKAFTVLSLFLVIAFYLWREKLLNLFSLSFAVFALFAIREELSLRPHTFAYLFFVIFIALLFSYKKTRDPKLLISLAATQLVWVNLHASFLWGILFTGIFVASELILTKKIDKKNLLLGGAVLLASFLHLFYGPSYVARIVTEFFSPEARIPIRDLLRPDAHAFLSLMGLVLLSSFVVLYGSFRRRQFDVFFSLTLMSFVAFMGARFVRDVVLFLALTLPHYAPLGGTIPFLKKTIGNIRLPPAVWRISFFLFLATLFFLAKNSNLGIGLGLEKFMYPVKAAEFLKQEQILERSQGRLYHTYNFGGYLMWTNQPHKVFIDGRVRPYHGAAFNRYWANFEGGEIWKDTAQRYHITAALMTLPHTDGKTVYNVSVPMFPKEEWALVYYDDVAMLYVRRIPELQNLIERYEYKILDPQNLDVTYLQTKIQNKEEFEAALKEIQKGLEMNPDSFRLHFTLAYAYSLGGLQDRMAEELKRTLEINPNFTPARNILNQVSSK